MSKQIAVIPLTEVDRIKVLTGEGKPLTQMKQGADLILNGGFYDMTTGKPTGHLKVDGKVLSKESWNTWGFCWERGDDIRMDVVPDAEADNYISGVELLTPAVEEGDAVSYPAEVGGRRGRTALALTGESLILYCSGDGTKDAKTPEELRKELLSLGAERAIMLDGGGSSQCDFRGEKIQSSRRVHNYIGVWLKNKDVKNTEEREEENTVKKVVLDPGHGVETPGKCAPDGSFYEHEFNLDMAKRLRILLERHGVTVVQTRVDRNDVSLSERVRIANEERPDLFVSLHSNASGDGSGWTEPKGFGIYTSAAGDTAERNKAAKCLLSRAKEAGIPVWGGGLYHDISLYVLKNTTSPAVLVEHGFHTNSSEVELLKTEEYRVKLAETDARGVLDYLGISWVEQGEKEENGGCCPHCGGKLKIEKG